MSYTSTTLFSSPLRKAAAEMEKKHKKHHRATNKSSAVWDCGSSLYDSFELKAFEKQLQSAMATGRTVSKPRTSSVDPPPPPSSVSRNTKKKNKPSTSTSASPRTLPNSVGKLLRAMFRVGRAGSGDRPPSSAVDDEYLFVADDDWLCGLKTIPEETCDKASGARLNYASVERRSLSERWFAGRTGPICR